MGSIALMLKSLSYWCDPLSLREFCYCSFHLLLWFEFIEVVIISINGTANELR